MKKILAILGLFLVLGGLVFAISGASVDNSAARARWTGDSAGSVTTEGGNITEVNLSVNTLTDKWADFYGNVSGNIRLWASGDSNYVYQWSVSSASVGEVCASQDQGFDWSNPTAATGASINSVWGFGSDPDNATNTYTDASCHLEFAQGTIDTAGTNLMGSSTFQSCALNDGNSAAETDFAFCSNISNGTNYNGSNVQYEFIVPTTEASGSAGAETYYFFAELS